MSDPQPMKVRRRDGVKRGDHGTYVAPETHADTDAGGDTDTITEAPAAGADRAAAESRSRQRANERRSQVDKTSASSITPGQRQSKAAYDARPKVIFRGVSQETYLKLRAMYRRQLRDDDGVLGWSEWGRYILDGVVALEEQQHGELDTAVAVDLPVGQPPAYGI